MTQREREREGAVSALKAKLDAQKAKEAYEAWQKA